MTTLNTDVGEGTWATIARLKEWLDAKDNATPQQARLLRLLKIQEEVGEVAQAAMGAANANPRKGASHTWQDVEHELCDVMLSSMVALLTLNPDAAKVFQERLDAVAERSLT
ncbi:MazG-like family protein [Actinacidiphila sp. ITFR-21]|uniref:MazG-like family protein n=1 Tax=Actinacidiphila sp. ITFR-21 TaxID=3075199 RepID=UPI00288A151A|nr:MazG-like family protein [Streptomyces sp. ITFR-21]WNI20310.1 MazG-like family protein [Streptomyces sp. ITFR-21]